MNQYTSGMQHFFEMTIVTSIIKFALYKQFGVPTAFNTLFLSLDEISVVCDWFQFSFSGISFKSSVSFYLRRG